MKETLIALRKQNRYTQTALAQLLGISRQSYIKYETGETEPSIETVRKLCEIYHVSLETIIGVSGAGASVPSDQQVDEGNKTAGAKTRGIYRIDRDFGVLNVASPEFNVVLNRNHVSIGEAAASMFALIQNLKAHVFDEYVIEDEDGAPVATLNPYKVDVSKRIGIAKGKFEYPEDFDSMNDEIAEMFYGSGDDDLFT